MKPFGRCTRVATLFLAAFLAVFGILGSTASLAQTGRLLNISSRALALTDDNVMIAGFIVGGSTPKTIVVKVTGPSHAGELTSPLANPTLELIRQSDRTILKTNDDWQTQGIPGDLAAITASGFQPSHPLEPAIIATLSPGAYTAIVRGVGSTTGVAVVEAYEVDQPDSPLTNISTRAHVIAGENVMIAGFSVGPTDAQTLVIRVDGPSLDGLVPDPLLNPELTLVRMSDRAVIATNNDWQVQANPADVTALLSYGLQPLDPHEPAIVATLPPGLYTAIASGVFNSSGNAVLSVFRAVRPVAITSHYASTFTVGVPGTFTVTTVGTPQPTSVTASGALPAGVTFTPASGSTPATLSGTPLPGTGGIYPLTITATNGTSPNAVQSFTLTVNEAPAITSAASASFNVGTPGTFTVVATGFPAPTKSMTGTLPAGLTFDPATGVLSGTPAAGTMGTYPLTFTAANGQSPDATQSFTLTVTQTVAITSANAATFTVGQPGTFTITTSATPVASNISIAGALPTGVSLGVTSGTGTAVLSGIPGPGTGGTYVVTITASNGGVTANGTQTFTLTVNQPPAITSGNAVTFVTGVAGTFNLTATGFPAPTFSHTGTLPAGVTLSAAGVLSGNPAAGGSFPITITASNGVAPNATQSFTLTVTQPPTITSASATTFTVGQPGSFNLVATGVPLPTFSTASPLPSGVTLSPGGLLSGTPNAGTGGAYPISITASNGVAPNAVQSFTLTVNQPPQVTSGNAVTFNVGTPGTFTITTTGFPSGAAMSIGQTGALPSGITLVDNGNGTATLGGTPAAGTAAGSPYALNITANNGVLPSASQPFTLTVTDGANAADDAYTVVHDPASALVVAAPGLLANDGGTPAPMVVSVTGLTTCAVFPCTVATTNGSVTVQSNGSLAYTPNASFAGIDTFTYAASNGVGAPDAATVTITVTNAPPILDLNGGAAGIDFAAGFTEGGGAVAIVDPQLTVTDADDITLTGATLTITNPLDGAAESLGYTCTGPGAVCSGAIMASQVTYTAATGVLEILATAALADYQALLRTITYNNASASPNTTARVVSFEVNDGNADNLPVAQSTVTVAAVNQAPTITVPGAQVTPVNTARVFSSGNGNAIIVADPDAGTADVHVTLTATNGTVTLSTTAGLTSVTGNGTATVAATGPIAAQNASLNGMSFTPATGFTSPPNATLAVNVNDLGNTGSGGPLSAPPATIQITVNTAPTITSANATTFTVGQSTPFTVTTSAAPPVTTITRGGVALPAGVSFVDNGDGTATLGGTPNAGTAGTYVFTFTASNGVPPDAVQNPFTLTIAAQSQTISFTSAAPGTATVGGATYNVTATATSGLAVTFTVDASASAVCAIVGSTVSFTGAGTCVINANQAGDATFGPAPQLQQSFAVGPGAQTISFTSVAPVGATFGGPTYDVTATATSGLAVTFTIDASASAVCSIAGSTVSFIGAGTCVVNANQGGNANYNPAPQVQQSFAVAKASQNITFTSVAPTAATVGGATYNGTATATSGLAVTFTIDASASAVCSLAGATVSFIGNGTCVINANQAGDANYNAAPQVQQSFAVKSNQTIAFTSSPPATPTVGGATYLVTATATSGLAVAFTIDASASAVCSIAGATVSFIGGGTCVINANQPGDAAYYAAPQVQQSFTVKSAQAITFTSAAPAAAVYQGPTYNVTATGGGSGNAVTFTIDAAASAVCSIAGSTVSFVGTGVCVINANQLGNALFYDAPQVQQSFGVGPNLAADSYAVVGNTQLVVASHSTPSTPATADATGVLANDTSNAAITVTAASGAATTGGGLITIGAGGTFTYTPPVGQSTGTDTYVYTGTSNGVSRTATITFNIANVVWYVNRSAPAGGNGRSNTPFDTLNGAQTPSLAGSYIYVHAGGAPSATPGNLLMDSGQELRGEGVAFTVGTLSLAAGTRPVLSGTVTLADDTLVTGVNFVNASPAIQGSTFTATQPILIDQVNVTGGNNALNLTNVNSVGPGALTFSNAVISNTTGAEVLVSGGNIPLTFPASTTITGNAGRLIDIQGRSGNAVTFAGALTDSGTGIFLNNNNATAFTFAGGMTLNGTGTTFTATNPGLNGTLSITGLNNIGQGTAPTSGTALNVSNIAIAAGGISFRSVHQNGGTSGIVLNNTGTTAGLTVTGNGVGTVGGDGSGGTLQNLTSYGVQLTSTRSPSLTNMNIQSTGRSGVDGQTVTNFTFASGTINNVGTGAAGQYEESNIAFNDGGAFLVASLDGAVSITNSILNNARRHGIQIENGSGTISNLTITGNQLTSSTLNTVSLGTAILVMPQGSAGTASHITTGSISNNTIANFPSGEGIAVLGGIGNSSNGTTATLGANGTPIVISGNAINGGATRMGSNAIRATMNSQSGIANFTIQNNGTVGAPVTNIEGQGISVFMGGTITGTTTIDNNVIVANQTLLAGTQGLAVQVDDGPAGAGTSAADYNVFITNNSVSAYEGFGIRAIARASLGKMDLTITGNAVGTPILANRNGIRVDSGSAVGDTTVCLAMSGNTSDGSGINAGLGIRKQGTIAATNDFGIVGLSPSPTTGATAAANLNAANPAGGGTDVISGDNFTSCTITP